MATVNLSLEEFQALERRARDAEIRVSQLEQDLINAKLNSGDSDLTKKLTHLARSLLDCTRFAVGNLPPETTRNFPSAEMVLACSLIPYLPDYQHARDMDVISEFNRYVVDSERIEKMRRAAKQIVPSSATQSD